MNEKDLKIFEFSSEEQLEKQTKKLFRENKGLKQAIKNLSKM